MNSDAYKNMVGVFMQPEFVICDINLLKTLPEEEIVNGFAEIVKHALINDYSMFEFIEQNKTKALELDHKIISKLVTDSIRIKLCYLTMEDIAYAKPEVTKATV